jgi:hypothetical protein
VDHGFDVATGSPHGAGDHPHGPRQKRQWALAGGREEALGQQLRLEGLQGGLQLAAARGLDPLGDDLQAALHLVEAHPAVQHHHRAFGGLVGQGAHGAAVTHALDAGLFVLEGEVDVAAGVLLDAADLALHHQVAEAHFEVALEAACKLPDGLGEPGWLGDHGHGGGLARPPPSDHWPKAPHLRNNRAQ